MSCVGVFLTKFNSVGIQYFLQNFLMLPYTCRNHASYTRVNFGTSQKLCCVFEEKLPLLRVLASYLIWNMFPYIREVDNSITSKKSDDFWI